MIKCPNCGNDNQDTARFCRTCGKPMPITRTGGASQLPSALPSTRTGGASQLPSALPSALPQSPQTQQPQRMPVRSSKAFQTVQQSSALPTAGSTRTPARPLTKRIATTINPSTQLRGTIVDEPAERRDLPPRDPTKLMIWLGIGLLVVPPLLFILLTVGIFLCVLAALGAGALLACLAFPLGLGLSMFNMFRPPQRIEVPYLEFRIQEPSGNIVNVEMIGKRRGGKLTRKDEVQVDGEWTDSSQTTMRAYSITVLRAGAGTANIYSAGATISTDRPLPRKAGTTTLIACGVIALVLYVVVPAVWYMTARP